MRNKRALIFRAICAALLAIGTLTCQAQKRIACQIEYENQNQVDYSSQPRAGLVGVVTDPAQVPMPNVCLGVFTEKGHRLVVSMLSNAKGRFELPLVLEDGPYRLVAKFSGFGVANMKFKKVPETVADSILHVHMRAQGIDTTSYIDTK